MGKTWEETYWHLLFCLLGAVFSSADLLSLVCQSSVVSKSRVLNKSPQLVPVCADSNRPKRMGHVRAADSFLCLSQICILQEGVCVCLCMGRPRVSDAFLRCWEEAAPFSPPHPKGSPWLGSTPCIGLGPSFWEAEGGFYAELLKTSPAEAHLTPLC